MTHANPQLTTRAVRSCRVLRTLGLALALLLMTCSPVLAKAPAPVASTMDEGPEIDSFDPESGPPGTYVRVEGSGFTPSDLMQLGGVHVEADWYGEDLVGFEVPDVGPGAYELSVHGAPGDSSACCFEVTGGTGDDGPSGGVGSGGSRPGGSGSAGGARSSGCTEPEFNVQCNEFGTIRMEGQREIRGERIDLGTWIYLNTAYKDREARWFLFSIRNVTSSGGSPVTIEVVRFATEHGDIVTSRFEQPSANEVNIWVDVLDLPVGTPIMLDMKVGATERGIFRLETLVLPFDRGYEPMTDSSGNEASLFSFTLIGVNEETSGASGAGRVSLFDGHKVPGLASLLVLVTIGGVAAFLRRRA